MSIFFLDFQLFNNYYRGKSDERRKSLNTKIFNKHKEGLKNRDPETAREALARTYLASYKLAHTSTELGIFMGGVSSAFALIAGAMKEGIEFPVFSEVKELEKEEDAGLFRIYTWALFNEYDVWRREQETKQINVGIHITNSFVESVHRSYKNFVKNMGRSNGKEKRNKDDHRKT